MKEAAKRLLMPYTTYVNYEKGQREPNFEALIQIAVFLTHLLIICLVNQIFQINPHCLAVVFVLRTKSVTGSQEKTHTLICGSTPIY